MEKIQFLLNAAKMVTKMSDTLHIFQLLEHLLISEQISSYFFFMIY